MAKLPCLFAISTMMIVIGIVSGFLGSERAARNFVSLRMADGVEGGGESAESPQSYVRCGRCQTSYVLSDSDLGDRGRGRRLECGVCGHTWFQSRDRIMTVGENFELVTLPEVDRDRIALNIEEGKAPKFLGDTKLYVGNIAFASTEEEIYKMFDEVGTVGDVSLVRDDLGRNRGFGFVTMRTKADGDKAIDALDGAELNGRNLAVRESNN